LRISCGTWWIGYDERRGVVDQFNSDALQYWAAYFAKPRLSRPQFFGGSLALLLSGLFTLLMQKLDFWPWPMVVALGVIFGLGPMLIALLRFGVNDWPRFWWQQYGNSLQVRRWSHAWMPLGWFAALAGSLSDSTWVIVGVAIVMTAVMYVALALLRVDRPYVSQPSSSVFSYGRIYSIMALVCASMFIRPGEFDGFGQASIAATLFVILMELSYARLFRDGWDTLQCGVQYRVLIGITVAVVLAAGLFMLARRIPSFREIGLIMTGVLSWTILLAQRSLLLACSERQRTIRTTFLTTFLLPLGLFTLESADPSRLSLNMIFVGGMMAFTFATCGCVFYNLRKRA
jgi:hypothetical protein